jgi:type II secretory pathway predicted ATPase ExeA
MEEIDNVVIQTHNLTSIFNVCKDSLLNQNMNAICAAPGYGKTTALVSFQRQFPENVVMIKVFASMSPSLFYSSIYNELASQKYDNKLPLYIAIKRAANLFVNQGKNMLLLIDEATKFNHNFFQHLQDFRDLTRGNTGIVIAGGDYFRTKFEKWSIKAENGMPEFYSRINAWQNLNPPTFDEIVAIIRAHDIHDNGFEKNCREVKDFRELKNIIDKYRLIKEKQTKENLRMVSS